jgi:SAM-dependent methyltransferase
MASLSHPFHHAGLAARSDFESHEWRDLFAALEEDQADFLSQEATFRSKEYLWPRDPLHCWSRAWEYPYAYFHLGEWRRQWRGTGLPLVVDVGSGVTFFPFSVARLGCHVICTDPDPVCQRDLERAITTIRQEPGQVSFRHTDGCELPFENAEADALYCISVIEHIPSFERTVAEMGRVLKPGSPLVLTIDLDLLGTAELSIEARNRLLAALQQHFVPLRPTRSVHPRDVLDTRSGPFPVRPPSGMAFLKETVIERLVKPVLGRKPNVYQPVHLAVEGLVLIRAPY